ncbi:hypothetical protein BT96DRAFT_1009471 [Gymnopus androsaceus JB14]|uniref:Uncharacterized protein n=1 Tax=Gymnopus androsaceus JB14 TaxID=1447944 RepID=A0A6A4GCS1_9AGAR|nr:hypothetical protein BT96DRAFT_1009471 [Gymnopus androsaceus JB14]
MADDLNKCQLISMPPEIISQIVDFCPNSSFIVLCHVSKLFHEFAITALYRRIQLDSYPTIIKWCGSAANITLQALYRTVGRALRRLSNLKTLKLSVYEDSYYAILQACHFPRLVEFQASLIPNKSLAASTRRPSWL